MNKLTKRNLLILIFSVIFGGIILDQAIKAVFESLNANNGLPIYFFGHVGFRWVENSGGAWSVFAGQTVVLFIVTVIGIPLFAALLYIARKKSLVGIVGYACVISGTIGNAIDRAVRGDAFFNGKVRDFLSIGDWFPTFNIADMLLVGGVIAVLASIAFFDDDALFVKKPKQQNENE